ncbi:hypothetical protein J5N97_010321 [Dioscorea zingiberensis]|uniref:Uncharacterized protein n=1 Tax=Dioscorea zingiberensis TaxID=325984 RepID=A0A9D5HMN7_9LILI|nr:hypothetical protein J5N97_010321 [Dioscorea zingiberensis]
MDGEGGDEPFSFAGAALSASVIGWEAVDSPPPTGEENGRGWEVVSSTFYNDWSIFPPSHHEGLHLRSDPDPHPYPPPDRDPEPSLPAVEGEEWVQRARRVSELARRFVARGVELFGGKLGCSGALWPYAAMAAAVAAVVLVRRRRRREKDLLLLLLQEKDQRINLLLHQISLMNEIIATRHQTYTFGGSSCYSLSPSGKDIDLELQQQCFSSLLSPISGGPLLDSKRNLIGINTAIFTRTGKWRVKMD